MLGTMKECRACDRVWGVFGVIVGAGILVIGIDLVTGGAITRALTGGARHLASVTPIREDVDDDTA
jgi:hypothetical protein